MTDQNTDRLRLELEQERVRVELLGAMTAPGLDYATKEIARLRVKVERQQEEIDHLKDIIQTQRARTMPDNLLPAVITDQKTVWEIPPAEFCVVTFDISVLAVDGRHSYMGEGFYPGDMGQLSTEVLEPFTAQIQRLPIEADIAGEWSNPADLAGLSRADFLKACQDLAKFRWVNTLQSDFISRQQEVFDYFWQNGMVQWLKDYQHQQKPNSGLNLSRRKIFKQFKQLVKRTLENMDKRIRENSEIGGVQNFEPTVISKKTELK